VYVSNFAISNIYSNLSAGEVSKDTNIVYSTSKYSHSPKFWKRW